MNTVQTYISPDVQNAVANSSASYAVPLSSVLRASNSADKVAVPVSNYTLFADFKHFTPVPAGPAGPALSISQLRMMDVLVDRLAQLRSQIHEGGLEHLIGISGTPSSGTMRQTPVASAHPDVAVHRLLVEYNATLQATMAAARERPYAPIIPKDTGSGVMFSVLA